jgi:serine/threonine protein kinase/tetratricopeptide (TPR) repeat protein
MEPKSIDRIYWDAAQIASPAERDAFLDSACVNDVELRRRVEHLLQARSKAEGFLESPPLNLVATADERPVSEGPGTAIGPYKLLEEIGEGGFGVVFMAEQQHPVRRKVALKILKPGMDTRQVVARFEAERQALALMDHPNIARIFDGGETALGRPYFVMELVKGIPITDYCDQSQLTTRERLELFMHVCQAVQHAHQKGIIHRDLKPSNVLVTMHDGTPVVKVIDFGIAKATGQQLTEKTLFTNFAQLVGTPLYMSPEQAALSGLDVDTRSDIYSLGVLLYELLTGTTPFDKERFRTAGYDEIRRIIREDEPPRPSKRLSKSKRCQPLTPAQRHMDSAKLAKLVRGELDWVVMKCLEKDRNRRYDTAADLAADIQRYLRHEPVLACTARPSYVLRKFVRRHRGLVAAVAVVLVVLLGGITATTIAYLQAEAAKRAEATQRIEVEQASAEARATADFLTYDLLALDPDAEAGRPNVTILEALDAAAPKIDRRLAGQPRVEAAVRNVIGATYRFHGQYEKAWPHLERAVGLRRSLLGPDHPATLATSHHLANVLHRQGKLAEADALCTTVLESRRKQLPAGHVDIASSLALAGLILTEKGEATRAEPLLRESLDSFRTALAENHWRTANARSLLGVCLSAQSRFAEAEPLLLASYQGLRNAHGAPPHHTRLALERICRFYEFWGKKEEAQKWRQKTPGAQPKVHTGSD